MRQRAFAARETDAFRYIEQAADQKISPVCFVSGGVDSVAMAGLLAQVHPCSMWAHLSDASFPGTRETLEVLTQKTGMPIEYDESPVSAFEIMTNNDVKKFGKKGMFFDAIRRFMERSGCDLSFVGVRAQESKRRMKACTVHGAIFESSIPIPHTKCFPLVWFSIEDVAAVLVKYDLPIHPIYDKINTTNSRIRLGYITAKDLMEKGTVVFLRVNYPELYNKLVCTYPDAARFL